MNFLNKYLILSILVLGIVELKAQLKPILVEKDTSIINKSSFKVYKIFDEKNLRDYQIHNLVVKNIYAYQKADTLILTADNVEIKITANSAFFSKIEDKRAYYKKNDTLRKPKIISYKTLKQNFHSFPSPPYYIEKKEQIKVNNYNLIIDRKKPPGCGVAGNNPFTIKDKQGKILSFRSIQNLSIFEFDIDKDKKNEIYIASYHACDSEIVVYQIVE